MGCGFSRSVTDETPEMTEQTEIHIFFLRFAMMVT